MKPTVLYEDNHLLVLEKPCNMPVQADASGDLDLLSWGKAYIKEKYQKAGDVYLGLVQRLDRPVGGVLVFARTSKAARRLNEDMKNKKWIKKYRAVVLGDVPLEMILEDYLIKDEKTRTSSVASETNTLAKLARLSFNCLQQDQGLSLLDIELETGRHHQIRVQLSSRGWPIWGDARYNKTSKPGQQIALWAYQLTILHPTKRTELQWTSAIPETKPWITFEIK